MVFAPSLQVSYVLVGDIVHLRLNQLPSDTFAVAIAVVRGEPIQGLGVLVSLGSFGMVELSFKLQVLGLEVLQLK